jgi:hypothetical protein
VTDPVPNSAEPLTPEPLKFYRSFTVGPDFPARLAATSFRFLLFNPAGLVRIFAIALALAVSAYIVTVKSNGSAYALALAGYGFAGLVVLMAVVTGVGFLVERRRFTNTIPPGSEFSVGFRTDSILMKSPMNTAEVAFSKFQSFEESNGFVVLRQRASRILNFLPAECFTPESLAYLREKIPLPTRR